MLFRSVAMRRQIREHTQSLERIVREKSARLVELERQIAVGQVVEGLSQTMRSLVEAFDAGPSYFNELPCFITVHNRFLEIVAANQLSRERLGDLVGRNSWESYAGRTGSGNACPVWMTIEQGRGQRSRETLVDREGREIPVIVHTAPIFSKARQVELVIEISVDASEVQRLQEDLRAAREKYQRLFDAAPAYIAVLDREFTLLESNRSFRADFGPHRQARCHEAFCHHGEPCERCPAQATFLDGEGHAAETVVTTAAGARRNVLVQTAPLLDEAGRVAQVMEIATDITQIRELQDHLSSLGLMLGSMSHGVKGLLTVLDGGVYKVDAGLRSDDGAKVREGWSIVRDKVGRIRKMVLDILYYAKSREPQREPVDLAVLAGDLAAIVEPKAAARGVGFRLEAAPEAGTLDLDESAMSSALVNFLENAVDACADSGRTDGQVVLAVRREGDAAQFVIRDNGVGMDRSTRERMFTLFFSSKGSRGTGLGLFISSRIVEQHGGRIAVESAPGAGTTITVTLPAAAPAAALPN